MLPTTSTSYAVPGVSSEPISTGADGIEINLYFIPTTDTLQGLDVEPPVLADIEQPVIGLVVLPLVMVYGLLKLDLIKDLHDDDHTIILITHNPEISKVGEVLVELLDGRVVSSGDLGRATVGG